MDGDGPYVYVTDVIKDMQDDDIIYEYHMRTDEVA